MKCDKIITKRIILAVFASLLLLLSACRSEPRSVVIEYPHTETKAPGLTVTKVVLTDSNTVLTFHVDCPKDYWLMIASTTYIECDGHRYTMTSSNGLIPDEKYWVPTNYGHDFSATFPALPEDAVSINFSEGPSKDAWRVDGIRLTRQADN